MRQRLLQHLSLAKPLRLALVLSTLLLTQTAWGQTNYQSGTLNTTNNTWGDWTLSSGPTYQVNQTNNLGFSGASTITLTLTQPANTTDLIREISLEIGGGISTTTLQSAKIGTTDITTSFQLDNTGIYTYTPAVPAGWSGDIVITLKGINDAGSILSATVYTVAKYYGINIGDVPVTNVNKDNVLGNGTISFTPATDTNPTNTLTLRGAGIGSTTTSFEHGITVTNLANLTIICAGDCYSDVYSTGTPIYCTDTSCDLTFTSEENSNNYIQFNTNATSLVEGFKTVTYVENKAEQFLPQKQIGFITYKINFIFNSAVGLPSLNTKTRTFDTTHLNSANFKVLSGGGFTFDPATCTLTILDGTRFGKFADEQLQQSAICTEIQWEVDADLRVVINGDCQIIGGVDGNTTYYPFHNYDTSTGAAHTGRKISFEKGAGATNVNLALVGVDSLQSNLISGFATDGVSLSSDLKWVPRLPLSNSASLTTNCDITVAGVPVTVAEGKGGITAGTGKIYFDGATKKMTMNGATVGGQIVSNLDELTIEFIGANSAYYISSTNESAPLTINGLTDAQTTTSTLSLTTGNSGTSVVHGFASLNYSNGTYLQSTNACRYKTDAKAIMSLSNVNTSTLSFTTTPYYPVWVKNQQVSSSNSGNVLNDGTVSYNAADHILTLDNATISNSNVIESELSDNLTIAFKGNNKLEVYTGNNSPIMSGYDTATLKFQKAGTGDCKLNIGFDSGVNLSVPIITGFASVDYTTDNLYYVSETGTDIKGSTTYDAMLSSSAIYPLWIAGTIVTEGTSSGTGWSYDATNNKLTLTNYTKADNDGHAFISNMANLNVYLVGTNTVGKQALSTGKAFYTTYTDATLTFSTDENNKGTLSASGYDIFCEGFRTVNGIYCNNGLGYYPGSKEIKAKATPTIKFAKRNQTSGDELSPVEYVGASETLQTAVNSAFKAPNPTFENGYEIFPDSTRYVYSYSVDGVVEFPTTGTNNNNPTRTDYGEISLLKAGTVTITCSFPGNMQNNACSASYTLNITRDFNNPFANQPAEQIYATYYNGDEDLTLPDGITAYVITGISGNTVTTTATGYLPHEVPVLLEKTGNVGTTITGYTGSAGNFSGNLLKYANQPFSSTGKEYVLYMNEFVKATGNIPGSRCYLDLSSVNPSRGMYGIGDGSTSIRELRMENEGRDEWYDLQGRRIEQPTKAGLYIKNGKKVIVNIK